MDSTPEGGQPSQEQGFQFTVDVTTLSEKQLVVQECLQRLDPLTTDYAQSRFQQQAGGPSIALSHVYIALFLEACHGAYTDGREGPDREDYIEAMEDMLHWYQLDREACFDNISMTREQGVLLKEMDRDSSTVWQVRTETLKVLNEECFEHLKLIRERKESEDWKSRQCTLLVADWATAALRERFLNDKRIQQAFGTEKKPNEGLSIAKKVIELECAFIRKHARLIAKDAVRELEGAAEQKTS